MEDGQSQPARKGRMPSATDRSQEAADRRRELLAQAGIPTPLRTKDLAKAAGMSRTSFATKFAQLMSMTPVAYITHWRMQIARQQLAETDQAIIDIAESTGYQSEAAFGRVFKKYFATPPARYRRQQRLD